MMVMRHCVPGLFVVVTVMATPAAAQPPVAKAHVANQIVKVENGVDEFRKYLERRGENAQTAASSGATRQRGRTATQSQKAVASEKKDELDDDLGALNRSTNRLRRKFDATDTWMQTKVEVEHMMDDGRKINQVVAKGKYGSDVAKLWAALRTSMNDLARTYGLAPMAI
jgi:hypothetical protein